MIGGWVLLGLMAGCAPGYTYPSRETPEYTFQTFDEAWAQGDLNVLLQVYFGLPRSELQAKIETNGEPAVREWYIAERQQVTMRVIELNQASEDLAYMNVEMRVPGQVPVILEFALLRIAGGWHITGYRSFFA